MSSSPAYPLVVASVNSPSDLTALPSIDLSRTCDVVEFRLDGIDNSPSTRENIAACAAPVILTARKPEEGAFAEVALPARLRLLQSNLKKECYVDLECATLAEEANNPELQNLLTKIATTNSQLIASFHDFVTVPDEATVDTKITIAQQHKAIVKIACTVNTVGELSAWTDRLAQLLASSCPFSFMGMGNYGMATRLTAASAGSRLNYGYLNQPSVPGQWPAKHLKQTLSLLARQ